MTLLPFIAACTLLDIRNQARIADNTGQITGKVTLTTPTRGKVVVVLLKKSEQHLYTRESYVTATDDGRYTFYVLPGVYYVGAFVDANDDNRHQATEPADVYGSPTPLTIVGRQEVTATITISGLLTDEVPIDPKNFDKTSLSLKNAGRIVSLQDSRFAPANGTLGLWKPLDFLNQYGMGLFLLEPYDSRKLPVIFIHGINGGPQDWRTVIQHLDRQSVQPWVLQYPSGLRLERISSYLARAVYDLQRRYSFKRCAVVAHSMGGLIARSFVFKYWHDHPAAARNLRLVMTINSPMNGLNSAALGVEHSPIIVPVWRDLASGSAFIRDLYSEAWPRELPYHLVFSYERGKGGDGVIPLESQLPWRLQAEATRLYGFNASHAGTLSDPDFLALLNRLLAGSRESGAGR